MMKLYINMLIIYVILSNIQIVSEHIEKRVEPLTYEEVFQACILTDDQFAENNMVIELSMITSLFFKTTTDFIFPRSADS